MSKLGALCRVPPALLLGLLLCLAGAGCNNPPNTKVGTPCAKDNDCTYGYDGDGKVVRIQLCARQPADDGLAPETQGRLCSRSCESRTDCPVGYECLPSQEERLTAQIDDTDAEGNPIKTTVARRLCFRCRADFDCPAGTFCEEQPASEAPEDGARPRLCTPHSQPTAADFGTDCAVAGNGACNGGGGFFCHRELADDPDAYCTRACKVDLDCPVAMVCGTAEPGSLPGENTRRCLRRTHCSSCRSDAECTGLNSLCVPDDRGRGYCTRACNVKSSMPCTIFAASRGHLECKPVPRDLYHPQQKVDVCAPRFGRCYDDGDVCDPCRPYTPEDCRKCGPDGCKKVSGRTCARNEQGEGVCRQTCDSTEECGENSHLDSSLSCAVNESSDDASDKTCTADPRANSQSYLKRLTCWP